MKDNVYLNKEHNTLIMYKIQLGATHIMEKLSW